MPIVQKSIYAVFVGLLLATLAISDAARVNAADERRIASSPEEIDPVKAGEKAPAFAVRTVENEQFRFDPDNILRPTVIVTFRGGWCPYCNMHLSELRKVVPEIRAAGIDILFLSGDRPEILYSNLKRETREAIDGLDYTILSDAEFDAATALGIAFRVPDETIERYASTDMDIAGSTMENFRALPVPAVFVIDTDGMVTFSFAEPDYRVRLSADDLLDAAMAVLD